MAKRSINLNHGDTFRYSVVQNYLSISNTQKYLSCQIVPTRFFFFCTLYTIIFNLTKFYSSVIRWQLRLGESYVKQSDFIAN